MKISEYEKNGYSVFRVEEDLGLASEVSVLREKISEAVESGARHIAVAFTEKSFLNTDAVGICVQCVELVHDHGGTLTIIRPNQQIREILELTTLSMLVKLVDSEDILQVVSEK